MRLLLHWKRAFALLVIPVMVLTLAGCHRQATTQAALPNRGTQLSAQPSGSSVAPLVAIVSKIQARPEYRLAQTDCRQKHYKQAAQRLQQLVAASNLTAEERNFAQEQADICLKDAGMPVSPRHRTLQKVATTQPVRKHLTSADADCGPRALLLICKKLGVESSLVKLRQAAGTTATGTGFDGLLAAVNSVGLRGEGIQVSRAALATVDMPAVAFVRNSHFVAVLSTSGSGEGATALIHDPNEALARTIDQESLFRQCNGYLLLVHR